MAPPSCLGYSGLVRVDDRLVHGQVLVNWVRALGLRRLVIADDALAADAVSVSIQKAVVPSDVMLWIGPLAAASAALASFGEPTNQHLVIVSNPLDASRLYDAGVHFISLNIGNLGFVPGRVRVLPSVSLSPEEVDALDTLASRGVREIFQPLPGDRALHWPNVRQRALVGYVPGVDR